MIRKQRHKREWGQGLLEFALILPVLLLVVVGTAEFGRIFAIYSNLFNAAREGTRYAMVNGDDLTGILNATLEKVDLIDPSKVTTTISYDSGPGTVAKSASDLMVGDRVIITIHYDVEPMSPLLEPLLNNLSVDTESVRTITKVGDGVLPDPPNQPPLAAFTYSCTDLDCTFDASSSSDPDGTIDTYAWDFGDGNAEVATGATTSHSYAAGGTYTVVLIVTDDQGATGTVSQDVTVEPPNQPPTAAFTYSCTDLSCTFDAVGSTDDDGSIISYEWDFGDGNTASGVTASHSYATGGTYPVVLTVTDDDGAPDNDLQNVPVAPPNPPPMAAFTYTCTDLGCTFDASGSSDDGTITLYMWQFGDGNTANSVTPSYSYSYAAGGTYNVTLTVKDDDGATNSASQPVSVTDPLNQPPVAAFTYLCTELGCAFDASGSSDTDGSIVAYEWDFGDGYKDSGVTANHNYAAGGTYNVTLTVTDDDGETGTVSQNVPVTPPTPIEITEPVLAGIRTLVGTAQPGKEVRLRDIQDPTVDYIEVVRADGGFTFDLSKGMVAGHVMVVEGINGYGAQDWAPVVGPPTTPTPGPEEIQISPTCGPAGPTTITVSGFGWDTGYGLTIVHVFEGVETVLASWNKGKFTSDFVIVDLEVAGMQEGINTIKAVSAKSPGSVDAVPFLAPCASAPNLVIESITPPSEPISTYDPLAFTVSIRNIGTPANTPFWAELYLDLISPPDPLLDQSAAWAAAGALDTGESILLSLDLPAGVSTTGVHEVYIVADSSNQVAETDELDNLAGPTTFTVSGDGTPPDPTPEPTPSPVGAGAISGSTWLYWDGSIRPQDRVPVYCYDSVMQLVAETISDLDGNYLFEGLAPGTYTVTGETTIGGLLYTDTIPTVGVNSGETTPLVTLYLQ